MRRNLPMCLAARLDNVVRTSALRNLALRNLALLAVAILWSTLRPTCALADPKSFVREQGTTLNAKLAQGKYHEAEKIVLGMIAYTERDAPADHALLGMVYCDAAAVYINLSDFQRALELGNKSLAKSTEAHGKNHFMLAAPLTNIGNALCFLGQFRESEQAHRRALALREAKYGVRSDQYADSLANLADTQSASGRYAEAMANYPRVLKIRVELHGPDASVVGKTLFNIGSALLKQERNDAAYEHFVEAQRIFQKSLGMLHPHVVDVNMNLGRAAMRSGRLDKAETHIKKSLAIGQLFLEKNNPYLIGHGDLDELYVKQARYAEAEQLVREEINRLKSGKNDPLNVASPVEYLACICMYQKKHDEAELLFAEAFQLVGQRDFQGEIPARWHAARGLNHLLRGQTKPALSEIHEAIRIGEQERLQFSGSTVEQMESFFLLRSFYAGAGMILVNNRDYEQALNCFERGRSRGLFDQMASAHVDPLQGLPAEEATKLQAAVTAAEQAVMKAEREFDAQLGKVDPESEAGREQLKPLYQNRVQARFQLVEANSAITNASPVYRKAMAREFTPVGLKSLTDWCQSTQTLLLYFAANETGTYAMYFDPTSDRIGGEKITLTAEQAKVLGLEAGNLTDAMTLRLMHTEQNTGLIDILKNFKRKPEQFAQAINQPATLWQVLVPQAIRDTIVAGKVKRIAIIPQAGLAYLPFEALVVNHRRASDIQYLLDVGPPVVYAPSATLLMNLHQRKPPEKKSDRQPVLTVSDPAYDAPGKAAVALRNSATPAADYVRAGGKIERLPFSGEESKAVVAAFKKHKIAVGQLLQATATEASVRFNAPGRKVLHLACHGHASSAYGNSFGSLVLAKGPRASDDLADDGFLTVAEIYPLDLRHCELAILSACTTNIGPSDPGEGVWAISRAFLVAGARRVVASSWEVSDSATAQSMAQFCETIAAGLAAGDVDYAQALHDAKRALRNDPKGADPALWAPFVLVGPQ